MANSPSRPSHHRRLAERADQRAQRHEEANDRHPSRLPSNRTTLLLIVAIFAAFLLITDRVIAGFVQCDAAQTCPWVQK